MGKKRNSSSKAFFKLVKKRASPVDDDDLVFNFTRKVTFFKLVKKRASPVDDDDLVFNFTRKVSIPEQDLAKKSKKTSLKSLHLDAKKEIEEPKPVKKIEEDYIPIGTKATLVTPPAEREIIFELAKDALKEAAIKGVTFKDIRLGNRRSFIDLSFQKKVSGGDEKLSILDSFRKLGTKVKVDESADEIPDPKKFLWTNDKDKIKDVIFFEIPSPRDLSTVFLGGTGKRSQKEVEEVLSEFEVFPTETRIVKRRDGKSKGFAYLQFKSREDAISCVETMHTKYDFTADLLIGGRKKSANK
ncbi:hypothetical protein ADUPG1_011269 [Aduncisulcus paluster]|uniref:RRM domain-containing protein n=1 Tax=Aduncisulcus paluster TaxID=2918883 RepID=A0ABQ5JUZ9_9EUKA|nr:hypothetical protein ADUPG1_011269 [Aduncisulcus paluster]